MSTCPKCGGYNIVGPHYKQHEFGGEYLLYRCARCGYASTTPTHDARKAPEMPREIPR